ncbi:MAG: hypothetical protein IRZ08_11955 [Frankia sp.]|nr:hypothetical protein [Frankia sp.]
MARGRRDGAGTAGGPKAKGAPAQGGPAGTPQGKPAKRPTPPPPDLKAALPYFLARFAVFIVLTFTLLLVGLSWLPAVLAGMVAAGVLTYPLARMQRRAAERNRSS